MAVDYKPTKRFWVMPWRKHFRLRTCIQLWRGEWASPMEALFWQEANRPWWRKPLPGLRRQYPISTYCVDFALPDKWLVIEIDGKEWHSSIPQQLNDEIREDRIKEQGWRILRFSGSQINGNPRGCVFIVKGTRL